MWTLVARAALRIVLPEHSTWGFLRIVVRLTDPLVHLFKPVTPGFLVSAMVPLYVAWFFFMLRFYVLPPLLGFGVMGTLSFPLESDIANLIAMMLN
ncbi:MAG: hypothetical protein AAF409_13665 [Pseudomonadota bacterium]